MKKTGIILCLFVLGCTKADKIKEVYIIQRGRIDNIKSLKNISLRQSDTIIVTFSGGSFGSSAHHLETVSRADTVIFKAYYIYPQKPPEFTLDTGISIWNMLYLLKPDSRGSYTYVSSDGNTSATTVVN